MFILALLSNFLKAFVIWRISKHVLFYHPDYLWKYSSLPRQIIMENILSIWQWTTDTAFWEQSFFCSPGHVSLFNDYVCKESLPAGKMSIVAPVLKRREARDDHGFSCKFCPVRLHDPIKTGFGWARLRQESCVLGSPFPWVPLVWSCCPWPGCACTAPSRDVLAGHALALPCQPWPPKQGLALGSPAAAAALIAFNLRCSQQTHQLRELLSQQGCVHSRFNEENADGCWRDGFCHFPACLGKRGSALPAWGAQGGLRKRCWVEGSQVICPGRSLISPGEQEANLHRDLRYLIYL